MLHYSTLSHKNWDAAFFKIYPFFATQQCQVQVEGHAASLFCLGIKRSSDTLGSAHSSILSLYYIAYMHIYLCIFVTRHHKNPYCFTHTPVSLLPQVEKPLIFSTQLTIKPVFAKPRIDLFCLSSCPSQNMLYLQSLVVLFELEF